MSFAAWICSIVSGGTAPRLDVLPSSSPASYPRTRALPPPLLATGAKLRVPSLAIICQTAVLVSPSRAARSACRRCSFPSQLVSCGPCCTRFAKSSHIQALRDESVLRARSDPWSPLIGTTQGTRASASGSHCELSVVLGREIRPRSQMPARVRTVRLPVEDAPAASAELLQLWRRRLRRGRGKRTPNVHPER